MVQVSSNVPPGPRLPELAQGAWFQIKPEELMRYGVRRYGEVWTLLLPSKLINIVISDPALVTQVFEADPAVVAGSAPPVAEPLFGSTSLLRLNGAEHANQRKLLAPPFKRDHVASYRERMRVVGEREIAELPVGEPIGLLPRLRTITLRMMVAVVFGEDGSGETIVGPVTDLVRFSTNPANIGRLWMAHLKGWKLPSAFVRLRAALDEVIFPAINRTRRDPRLHERDDVLAMVVRATDADGREMGDREVRDEIVTLLMQGHTSTASALAWTAERLVRNPDKLERLTAEVQTASEEYLEAVIYEALRLRGPLPIPQRRLHAPYELGGYSLDTGTYIFINAFMLHRREDLYPDAERFVPERFVGNEPRRDAWMPFGGGVRGCIGVNFALCEMKVVLRALLQQVRLAPSTDPDEGIRRRGVAFDPNKSGRVIISERLGSAPA